MVAGVLYPTHPLQPWRVIVTITFPIGTPDDADLTIGTPAHLFRAALAHAVHGDNGDSWERGMRAFAEAMINCVNVTQISHTRGHWDLLDTAVRIGLTAAAEGRTDADAAIETGFVVYTKLAAHSIGDPVPGLVPPAAQPQPQPQPAPAGKKAKIVNTTKKVVDYGRSRLFDNSKP
jgi:hypothetical protein